MRYAWLVAIREFAENARTKGFWIGLFMLPLLLAAGIRVPLLLEKHGNPTRRFVLVDRTGRFSEVVDGAVEDFNRRKAGMARALAEAERQLREEDGHEVAPLAMEEPAPRYLRVDLPEEVTGEDPAEILLQLRPYLRGEAELEVDGVGEELYALVLLSEDFGERVRHGENPGLEFWCRNLANTELRKIVEDSLEVELRESEYQSKGLRPEDVERIGRIRVSAQVKDPAKELGEEVVSDEDTLRQWAPTGFVYLLFISLMSVSQMLLNSTLEEKSNRIVEVLFSSITAWELVMGKLMGVAMVSITMLLCWLGASYLVILSMGGLEEEVSRMLLQVVLSRELLLPFAFYFITGYLLYAGAYLAVGSICSTIKDAQNYVAPMMIISMVPILTMAFIPKDPNGTLAVVLSWVPPWTPFVMMNRAAASPPAFQVVGTGIVLILSVALVLWISGRVFQGAILRSGEPPRLIEVLRSLRS